MNLRSKKDPPEPFGFERANDTLNIIGRDTKAEEKALHSIRKHWIVLVENSWPAALLGVCLFLIAIFRAMGGTLLVISSAFEGEIDLLNILLIFSLCALAFAYTLSLFLAPKSKTYRHIISGVGGVLILLLTFRYMGGRVFYFDPSIRYSFQVLRDYWNIGLFVASLFAGIFVAYQYFEWEDEVLILTTERVIKFQQQFMGTRHQDQIGISDIQTVTGKTTNYIEHWLQFGTLTVKSATLGRDMVFDKADKPLLMQQAIMKQVNAIRSARSAATLDKLISTRIYGERAKPDLKSQDQDTKDTSEAPHFLKWFSHLPKEKTSEMLRSNIPFVLRWLLPPNPDVVRTDNELSRITWRRHWIFFVFSILKPILFLLVSVGALLTCGIMGIITTVTSIILFVLTLFIFLGWVAWEFEDFINDHYILEVNKEIIDIDKKPFGPEDRRTAGLGKIQSVEMKTTVIGQVVGYGDVVLTTAGSNQALTFKRVANPVEVSTKINEALANYRRGESERTFNDTVTLLKHYHKAQEDRGELNVDHD